MNQEKLKSSNQINESKAKKLTRARINNTNSNNKRKTKKTLQSLTSSLYPLNSSLQPSTLTSNLKLPPLTSKNKQKKNNNTNNTKHKKYELTNEKELNNKQIDQIENKKKYKQQTKNNKTF